MSLLCLITACRLQNVVSMSFCADSICEISALSASDFVSGFDLSSFSLNVCALMILIGARHSKGNEEEIFLLPSSDQWAFHGQ